MKVLQDSKCEGYLDILRKSVDYKKKKKTNKKKHKNMKIWRGEISRIRYVCVSKGGGMNCSNNGLD